MNYDLPIPILSEDLIREIYQYDPTYHNFLHKKNMKELELQMIHMYIILSAHYTSSSDNIISRINSREHEETIYPPTPQRYPYQLINKKPINKLFYRYYLIATSN